LTASKKPEKPTLHLALLQEQGWTCCYCGRAITADDSHIEHFRPQHAYPELALDYGNLHASCLRAKSPGMPLHCGHGKDDAFDEEKQVSPLAVETEARFLYTLNGQIEAANPDDDAAQYMVDLLCLDIPSLKNRRGAALSQVFDDEFLSSATDEELRTLRDRFRQPDAEGKIADWGHVLARYAEQQMSPAAPQTVKAA
jgi:uncharacterized protein (TIGR02646 family)